MDLIVVTIRVKSGQIYICTYEDTHTHEIVPKEREKKGVQGKERKGKRKK